MEKTKRITVTIPKSILSRLDKERKDTPLSRFITRKLEESLGIKEKEKTEYV
jgi:metal-responsive CopG/Arc/MetJ family transcriptional regulator